MEVSALEADKPPEIDRHRVCYWAFHVWAIALASRRRDHTRWQPFQFLA